MREHIKKEKKSKIKIKIKKLLERKNILKVIFSQQQRQSHSSSNRKKVKSKKAFPPISVSSEILQI